jgi:general secretion pathway protein D
LKTTQRILAGWIAVAMSLSAGFANAGLPDGLAVAWLGGAVLGQQGGSGSIFPGFSSSPAAPPADPFSARGAAPAPNGDASGVSRLPPTGGPAAPAQAAIVNPTTGVASPLYFGNTNGTAVPGVQTGTSATPAQAGIFTQDTSIPFNQGSYALAVPQGGPVNPAPGGNRTRSDGLLRLARLALAVTDVRRASDLAAQARREQIRYAPNEDNPDRVDQAIARFTQVKNLDHASPEYRKAYTNSLMEQSEALLQWGELDQAERMAGVAVEQRVAYGPYEPRPEDLLKRIAALRQQINPAGPRPIDDRYAGPNAVGPSLAARQQAVEWMRQIRAAMARQQIEQAAALCRQLQALQIPESAFAPGEDTPGRVFEDVRQAMARRTSGVVPAGGFVDQNPMVQRADYDPSRDPTRNMLAAADQPLETIPAPTNQPGGDPSRQSPGYSLFQQGEAALKARETARALDLFRRASAYIHDLDPTTASRLQDHISLLSVPRNSQRTVGAGQPPAPADDAAVAQEAFKRKVYNDVNHSEAEAKRLLESNPRESLNLLQEARKSVEVAGLEPGLRDQLLRRLDRSISETEHFIEMNKARIELNDRNENTRDQRRRDETAKLQRQQKLAELVDQYNKLNDEMRFEEAEVIARRAYELAPHEMVTSVMVSKSSILVKLNRDRQIRDEKADKFADSMIEVSRSAIAMTGDEIFPDAKHWKEINNRKAKLRMEERRRRHFSDKEYEIEKKLQTPINYSCRNRPLTEVLNQLAKLANINIHLDEDGLRQEGMSGESPVTLELASEIQLKSYLNLILQNYHLCYIIKDEVLNITSESKKGEDVFQVVYNVGDLVMPIPNFTAGPRMGLAGALHDAMGDAVGAGGGVGTMMTPMATVASKGGQPSTGVINPALMANFAPHLPGGANQSSGPGGAGGGNSPDFETLIDLIEQTVAPTTWDHNGGKGNIAPSPTNLSLVVSQTQEVHEQIVDLLEQLRRMQDLQITIEVRFITLSDSFFERIGVDFDFNIAKNISNPQNAGFTTPIVNPATGIASPLYIGASSNNGTAIPGIQAGTSPTPAQAGIFTQDTSIPFNQGSYALAVPQFGGFDATAGASVGFAILSDIEAYFFINAAQGDKRTNVLQAPKVTLFNGQQAFVSDTSQTPFVISVIPVVGEFAAAQQPVIVVLSEGTFMTVQAVVSNDRRFVRLTIVPFFSKIGNVQNFTFQGTQTTTTDTSQNGGLANAATNLFNNNASHNTTSQSGVTVQLPTFSFTTVTTTVSVPDGGTVLLGGIKRLSEGRTEFGVPILDKVPYLDRLFKNVGIGRDASSLMMMVTPRIIIQEEEEERMGVSTPP